MKNILMFYDQIQAGMGTKDDSLVPLGIKKEIVGPAVMMTEFFRNSDVKIAGCIYCGTEYYNRNKDDVKRKIITLINKVKADAVIFGPTFDYKDFAIMGAEICEAVKTGTDAISLLGMSEDVTDVFEKYKEKIDIVKVPKKGGIGLNDALKNLAYKTLEKLR